MNHLTLRGTHREMGFQWGARLAERGLRLLDHVPFPLEAERRAFAAACRPAYARHFPAALEELEGLAAGQNCRQEDLETVLFTTYALPPACGCSCLAVSNGNGVFFGRNSDFLTALEPDYTHVTYGFSDRAIPFTGNTTSFVQMEDAVNARGLAIGLTSVYTPRPRPGLNAGMVLRLLAETCAAVPEALDRLRALPLASCQTLTLADAAGDIAVAECSPEGMRVERPGPAGPFVCAANLFHSDLAVPLPPWLDSWRAAERYDTMRRVLEREGETLALSDVQALLAGRPSRVAGVPPDYFSEEGQLWGNPLYDWAAQKRDGFGWWIRRVEGASRLFDAIRIDHFRAFERYWSIPAGAETAKEGQWEPGPGMDLLRVLTGWFPHITYIAEDLGLLTPEVHQLREAAGLPGMKVLEFAFSDPGNEYLPHNYGSRRCVCYTGTHDNDTALGWYDHAGEAERAFAERYLGASGRENVRRALLRCGMGSTAELFVAQMQDYLALGSEGRINVPGVAAGNWRWRMAPGAAAAGLAAEIRALAEVYGRC